MKTLKNKTILFAVAAILVAGSSFFTSCNKEDDFNSTNGQYETKSLGTNISTRQIAQELTEAIKMNPEIATEIHSAIATVVDYGLDENITFYDILNTDKSVFLKSDANISNLRSAINVSTLQNLGLGSADNYYGNLTPLEATKIRCHCSGERRISIASTLRRMRSILPLPFIGTIPAGC